MAYSHLNEEEMKAIVKEYCNLVEDGIPVTQKRFAERWALRVHDLQILLHKYGEDFGWKARKRELPKPQLSTVNLRYQINDEQGEFTDYQEMKRFAVLGLLVSRAGK